ncbi:methionyl-tRNA formyltransferase-like protein [Pleomorphomonas koreensis]|uniref:methionyl-tRNA formyltransferase-like protein n=1 Tax=Pleomorphomonas koreensis TaxID=257440 RepID=UPI001FDEB02E|nr:methionyl-tRNA formyltransferase-like protein [Pleomorphomonas koreensis]
MQELNQILAQATASIEHLYFQLPIDGSDPIFRERVYCYELYHQLRRLWPQETPFSLNGEVDKQGHALIKAKGARVASPDLLIHTPGSMDGNHAIIEVKPGSAQLNGVCKDIRTLSEYCTLIGYKRAIYLFYGGLPLPLIKRAIKCVANEGKPILPIELWFHPHPGTPAEAIGTLQQFA